MWSKHRKFSTWRWTWWPPMSSFHRLAFTMALRTSYCWILGISRSESEKLDTRMKIRPTQNCIKILNWSTYFDHGVQIHDYCGLQTQKNKTREWAFWVSKTFVLLSFQMSSQSKKHLPQLSAYSSNIEDIMSRAYDSFDIQLSSLQFLYSKPGTYTRACTCQRFHTGKLERSSSSNFLDIVDMIYRIIQFIERKLYWENTL